MTDGVEPPGELPLFPIRGCILPPGEHLPLNVFEPRYLNMIDDAMAGDRYIGMIQPSAGGTAERPSLETIGTAGRIVSHSETEDGRYLIVLAGILRFRMTEEIDGLTPYRIARADYAEFQADLTPGPLAGLIDGETFLPLLRSYFNFAGIEADWDSIERAPLSVVVDKVAMAAPFEPAAKQALLTAPTCADRAKALAGLMTAALERPEDGAPLN